MKLDCEFRLCPQELQAEALETLYRSASASVRWHLVQQSMTDAERGELDLSGLWIAWRSERVVGAFLTQLLAGGAGAVWPPEVRLTWGRSRVAEGLVQAGIEGLARRGARVAQALLEVEGTRRAGLDLEHGGLPFVTELDYMQRRTQPLEIDAGTPEIVWSTFPEETAEICEEALETTYADSLDMPELEGLRSLEDIVSSHRAADRYDPSRWFLGRVTGEPSAKVVLLLADNPVRDSWDISYLGLSVPARGRGLGRAALAFALERARPHAPRLELAVDVRNIPAKRLYDACEFEWFDKRRVHFRRLA